MLKRLRYHILIFFSVIGPGFITAMVDNDAGGIYTYSQAGAKYGYLPLWTLIPITILLVVTQEMCSRMGAVTGKGLSDLIREEFGLRTTFLILAALVVTNFANVVANFAGVASSLELFHVSRYISVPIAAIVVWLLVVKGTYQSVERVFLFACVIFICYIISGVLVKPDWKEAAIYSVRPVLMLDPGYITMIIGMVGTSIAPWMQFYLQAAVVEKGIKLKHYVQSRWDVIIGCIIVDVVAFFIIVACAATIHMGGSREITSAADAALALKPLAGNAAAALFAFGLVNASLFAASILPLATAYTVCEGLGFESGIDKRPHEAPAFYALYTGLIILGGLAVLVLKESMQVPIILFSQVANGILLPFVLIFMLRLCNREDIMGAYRNSRPFNIIAWSTCVTIMVLTALLLLRSFLPEYAP